MSAVIFKLRRLLGAPYLFLSCRQELGRVHHGMFTECSNQTVGQYCKNVDHFVHWSACMALLFLASLLYTGGISLKPSFY